MAFNIPESSRLATLQAGHQWHPTENIIRLNGKNFSIPMLLQKLNDWNNKGNQAETKVCKLDHLHNTLAVTHYLLTRLYSDLSSDQAPRNLLHNELHKHIKAGNNSFWEFTRVLKIVENNTPVGSFEFMETQYVKNLEGNEDMEILRGLVDQNYNLVVVQRLKEVMDEEARKKLFDDLRGIDGKYAKLLA